MSDISQRIKYAVEIDASSLDKFAKQLTDAKAQMDNMLSSVSGLARAFEAVGGKTLKVKQTIVQQTGAVREQTVAVREATGDTTELGKAMEALERDLAKAKSGANNLQRAFHLSGDAAARLKREAADNRLAAARLTADLHKAARAVDQVGDNMALAAKQAGNMGRSLKDASNDGLQFLKVFGKFQAIKWLVRETFDLFKEGAQNLDLKRTLGAQIAGFDQLVAEVNQRTAGTIKEADLNKSLALMTSFGLEVKTLPRSMELVTKAAIRTGQSTEYLTESFARGVSRMSPLILDNLGIQLKLTDAYDAYAKKVGKATDALTKNEQIAAVQQATLKALEETTRGIVLEDSAGASAARFEKFFSDAWMSIKEVGGLIVQTVDRVFESHSTKVERLANNYANLAVKIKELPPEFKAFLGLTEKADDVISRADKTTRALVAALDGLKDRKIAIAETSIVQAAVFGQQDPESAIRDLDKIRKRIGDFQGSLTQNQTERLTGALGGVMLAGLDMQVKRAMANVEKEFGRALTKQEMLTIEASLYEQQLTRVNTEVMKMNPLLDGTIKRKQGIVDLVLAYLRGDQAVQDVLEKNAKADADRLVLAKKLNAENAAFVQSLQDSIKARTRELEYADKTHILQIDANKAKAEEARLTQEIAKVVAAYNDEEQAANRGANLAKLKQLELAKKIAIATTDGAKAAWDIEQERVKDIIKAGKAAVQAELLRLDTFIKQNEVLLTQLEVYAQMPGMALAMTAASAKMRNDIEIAKDSAAMLKTHLTGLGGSRGGGRAPSEPDFSVRKQFDKQRNNRSLFSEGKKEAMRMFKEFREMLNVQPAGSDVWGFFGLNDESVKTWFKDVVSLRDKIVDKFGNFAELARVLGPNWQADFEGLTSQLEHLDALMSHFERLKDVADGIDRFNVALGDMNNGLRGLEELFGEPGQRWVGALNDMKTALDGMSEALRNNADAYQLSLAGVAISRSLTQNIIKDLRARAAVEGGMQTALAAAAFATGNIPGGIAHSAAAALFFGLALKGKKAVAKKDTPALSGSGNMRVARSDVHVHIAGTVVQTEAERGVMIQRAIREARAGGR